MDHKLQIKLMCEEANKRLADARYLSQSSKRQSDSNHLLELLAFEILLKCVVLIHIGKYPNIHDYKKLFSCLPEDVQSKILNSAKDRMSTSADYSDFKKLLKTYSGNFILLRYPYQKYEELTEAEYQELGANWIKAGAKVEEATYAYYPEELTGLIYALNEHINKYS